jgi:hypothetical protein
MLSTVGMLGGNNLTQLAFSCKTGPATLDLSLSQRP